MYWLSGSGSEDYRTERRSETYHRGTEEDSNLEKPGYKLGVKDILNCVRVLVTNPTFMLLNLAAACEGKNRVFEMEIKF